MQYELNIIASGCTMIVKRKDLVGSTPLADAASQTNKPMRKYKIVFIVDGRKQPGYYVDSPEELMGEMEEVFGTDCNEWLEEVREWAEKAKPGESLIDDDDVLIYCVRRK